MSALRDAREREDNTRDRGRGRGSQVQFYDDMGFSSTEQGHEKFVEYKDTQAKQIAARKAEIAKAQGAINQENQAFQSRQSQYNTAQNAYKQSQAELEKAKQLTDPKNIGKYTEDAYSRVLKSGEMKKVAVVSGNDNKVEGYYWVPKGNAEALTKSVQFYNTGKDGTLYVHTKSQGRTIGEELHKQLSLTQQSAKTQVMSAAQKQFAEQSSTAQKQIAAASSNLSNYKSQLDAAKAGLIKDEGAIQRAQATIGLSKEQLKNYTAQEAKFLKDLGDKYDGKIDRMREIVQGVQVKEGQSEQTGGVLAQLSGGKPTVTQEIIEGNQVQVPQAEAEVPAPNKEVV